MSQREGTLVQAETLEKFASGLALNEVDRAELYIRHCELALRSHLHEQKKIEDWIEKYLDNKDSTIGRINLAPKLDTPAVRAAFGKAVRRHLFDERGGSRTKPKSTKPMSGPVGLQKATIRELAQKLSVNETALHNSLTDCSLGTTTAKNLLKELSLSENEKRKLLGLYAQGYLGRQFLFLEPKIIKEKFKPVVHKRLAHWLAAASR